MGKNQSEYDLSILSGKHYSKSNALVNSKGKSNLLAQKLFAIAIQQAEEDKKTGILTTTLHGTDLKKIFGVNKNRGSFYDEIRALVEPIKGRPSLLDWRVIFTDDVTKKVEGINIITDCTFEDGIFQIRFNNKVNKQVRELKQNYTVFSLVETIPLKSLYSFKLYEILKAEYDKQDYYAKKNNTWEPNAAYIMDIDITDLKLRFGIIDASISPEITQALKKSNPDYKEIERLTENLPKEIKKDHIKYKRFDSFRKATLDVAQKELEEKTSISFEYEQIKAGRGGKTVGIRFTIHKKQEEFKENSLTDAEKIDFLDDLYSLINEHLGFKDYPAIAEAAHYNMDLIKEKYEMAQSQEIDNLAGWLIKALKEDYSMPVKSMKKAPENWKFEQRQMSLDDMEDALIDNF